ncbi:MAG: M23 family metallopeptidase [Aggregatilineales bacterium]
MQTLWQFLKRNLIILPVALFLILFTGGLIYLVGQVAIAPGTGIPTLPATPTVSPLAGTPIAQYPRVNPAILQALDYDVSAYGDIALSIPGLDVQPVGAYLPRSGNTVFEVIPPTPLPTPLPYPTSPPLPLPPLPDSQLPDGALDTDGTPRTLPYAGDACAPAGRPVAGILTQRFHLYHGGIDLSSPLGTPVLATHSGTILFAGWSEFGYGYLVIIQNDIFITYYAHNTSFNVVEGQKVGKDSIIAWSGSTGNSTGPHVHYETRINDVPVDPLTFETRGYPAC